MYFIKKILHLIILLLVRKFGMCSPPYSPCPDIFLYKYEGNRWIGEMKIIVPDRNVNSITLEAAYYVKPAEEMGTSKLIKKDTDDETISNLSNGRPITFTLIFPVAEKPHWIKEIKINGKQICKGRNQFLGVVREKLFINIYEIQKTYLVELPTNHGTVIPFTSTTIRPPQTTKQPQTTKRPQHLTNHNDESNSNRRIYTIPGDMDKCGTIPDTKAAINLISNGVPAVRQPWLVALYENTEKGWTFFCGGTLITSQFVITAAHCILDKTFILLALGTPDVSELNAPGSIIRTSTEFKENDQYVRGSSDADIAIIKMSEAVDFTSAIQPVCMWPNAYLDENTILNAEAKVFGWGSDENGLSSRHLKTTSMRIKPLMECKQMDLLRDTLSERTICAASDDFRSGPCRGDSGGGLYLSVNNRTAIRGIISSAVGSEKKATCDHTYFSVFTDVGKHFDWIRNRVNQM